MNVLLAVLVALRLLLADTAVLLIHSLVISLPVMWLWDAVMPDLFGLKEITWIQALLLAVLCTLLFKTSASTSSK